MTRRSAPSSPPSCSAAGLGLPPRPAEALPSAAELIRGLQGGASGGRLDAQGRSAHAGAASCRLGNAPSDPKPPCWARLPAGALLWRAAGVGPWQATAGGAVEWRHRVGCLWAWVVCNKDSMSWREVGVPGFCYMSSAIGKSLGIIALTALHRLLGTQRASCDPCSLGLRIAALGSCRGQLHCWQPALRAGQPCECK